MGIKVTNIQEIKDLKILTVDHLLDSVITHEMIIGEEPSKKKKDIVFKATTESKQSLMSKNWLSSLRNLDPFSTKIQMEEDEKLANKRHPMGYASNVEIKTYQLFASSQQR